MQQCLMDFCFVSELKFCVPHCTTLAWTKTVTFFEDQNTGKVKKNAYFNQTFALTD